MNTRSLFFRAVQIAVLLAVLFGLGLFVHLGAPTTTTLVRERASAFPLLGYPLVALPILHAL